MHKIKSFANETEARLPAHCSPIELTDFCHWWKAAGSVLYEEAFKQETMKKISTSPNGSLIERAYFDGETDHIKKSAAAEYYRSNAAIFLRVAGSTADRIVLLASEGQALSKEASVSVGSVYKIMMFDALQLIDDWAAYAEDVPAVYGIGKNWGTHSVQLAHAVRKAFWGRPEPFTFSDAAPHSATPLLRGVIETRIRQAFGVHGARNSNGAFVPVMLSRVIEGIKDHEDQIKFAVPFQHVVRLYKWCNTGLHMAFRDYVWLPIFALDYIWPLLVGLQNSTNVNCGIKCSKATIETVQNDIEAMLNKDGADLKLMKAPPEHCSVALT